VLASLGHRAAQPFEPATMGAFTLPWRSGGGAEQATETPLSLIQQRRQRPGVVGDGPAALTAIEQQEALWQQQQQQQQNGSSRAGSADAVKAQRSGSATSAGGHSSGGGGPAAAAIQRQSFGSRPASGDSPYANIQDVLRASGVMSAQQQQRQQQQRGPTVGMVQRSISVDSGMSPNHNHQHQPPPALRAASVVGVVSGRGGGSAGSAFLPGAAAGAGVAETE